MLVPVAERPVVLRCAADRVSTADLVEAFEGKLGRALAIVEDELRAEFGDVEVDY